MVVEEDTREKPRAAEVNGTTQEQRISRDSRYLRFSQVCSWETRRKKTSFSSMQNADGVMERANLKCKIHQCYRYQSNQQRFYVALHACSCKFTFQKCRMRWNHRKMFVIEATWTLNPNVTSSVKTTIRKNFPCNELPSSPFVHFYAKVRNLTEKFSRQSFLSQL